MIGDDFDPDGPASPNREGEAQLYGLPVTPEDALVRVLPVPFEATASFGHGTSDAPRAVLEASWQVDLCDPETGEAWRAGIAMLPQDPDFARWNAEASKLAAPVAEAPAQATGGQPDDDDLQRACDAVNRIGAEVNERVREQTAAILDAGAIPAILGGDHSVPYGAIAEAITRYPGMSILHVDAHADLRVAYQGFTWSHASIFHNVMQVRGVGPLVQVGVRDVGYAELRTIADDPRIHTTRWAECALRMAGGVPWLELVEEMLAPLGEDVWISFDIDGLDPAYCPGTGTPVPGGPTWDQAVLLLHALRDRGCRVVGFDLCEVGADPWDANVGARLLYKLACTAIATRQETE